MVGVARKHPHAVFRIPLGRFGLIKSDFRRTIAMTKAMVAVLLGGFLLVGCAQIGVGFSKIGDVMATPQNYSDKQILIRGTVSNALKLPFIATRLYSVRDSTGEIYVRTDKEPPPAGSEIHIRGVLDTVAVLGNQNVGLHLREIERW
jgi:hypothetical protein